MFSGEMNCGAIHSLTFTELVGAFLDLGIAYLLLCASSLAYFASKFLGFFGLTLPCPCDGLFGRPSSSHCLQRALVDSPREKTASVQWSVKRTFPFGLTWSDDTNGLFDSGLFDERYHKNRHIDRESEASSFSCMEKAQDFSERRSVESNKAGKRTTGQWKRIGLRQRHKRRAFDHGKSSSVSSYNPLSLDAKDVSGNPSCVSKIETEITEERSFVPVNSERDGPSHGLEAPLDVRWQPSGDSKLEGSVVEDKSAEEEAPTVQRELDIDISKTHTVRVLEQALEEEHAARTALYLELEKERCAASTAADEAMAMILRLQEEKASIEMESNQYQRMIEEKFAYDTEEMNILKEILLRREREKHFLEKEVEAYREMVFGSDQFDADMEATQELGTFPFWYSSEDPMQMPQQGGKSMDEEENLKNISSSDYEVSSLDLQSHGPALGKTLPHPELDEDNNYLNKGDTCMDPSLDKHPYNLSCEEIQEKGTISRDDNLATQQRESQTKEAYSQLTQSSTAQGFNLLGGNVEPVGVGEEQSDNMSPPQRLATKIGSHNEDETDIAYNVDHVEIYGDKNQEDRVTDSSFCDSEPSVHDVHVIDVESFTSDEGSVKKNRQLSRNNSSRKGDTRTFSTSETELDLNKSRSELTCGLPPKVPSRTKASTSDMRRKSMSAIDFRRNSMSPINNERLKIDNEVEWLQERLRTIKESREKLNFSMGNKEREKVQLQLLEDLASQIQEIRQLTEPGKAVRQTSLSPPSAKVMSKKRCWRSVSLGVR